MAVESHSIGFRNATKAPKQALYRTQLLVMRIKRVLNLVSSSWVADLVSR
jgi:hypothetical protein